MLQLRLQGPLLFITWAQIDLNPTELKLERYTAFPGGGTTVHTKWTDIKVPIRDGAPSIDPFELGASIMFCNGGLYYESWPETCSGPLIRTIHSKSSRSNISVDGTLGVNKYDAPVVYQQEDRSGYPLHVTPHLTAYLNSDREFCALSKNYNTQLTIHQNGTTTVRLHAARSTTELWISGLIALAFGLALVIWSQQPTKKNGARYQWLEADVAIAPAALNFGRIVIDHPLACKKCTSVICDAVCGTSTSSFIWAVSGLAIPCAITWSLSDYFPWLAPYKTHRMLTFTILEISLLGGSLAHLPGDAIGGRAYELAGFLVGTAMVVVVGRVIAMCPITIADMILVLGLTALVIHHVAFTLYRPIVSDHPSVPPDDWRLIAIIGLVMSLIPLAAGAQIGKTRFSGI